MYLRYLTVDILRKQQNLLNVPGENTQFLLSAGTTATFQCLSPNLILLMVHFIIADIEQLPGPSLQSSLVASLLFQICATLEQIVLVTGVEVVSHCT